MTNLSVWTEFMVDYQIDSLNSETYIYVRLARVKQHAKTGSGNQRNTMPVSL